MLDVFLLLDVRGYVEPRVGNELAIEFFWREKLRRFFGRKQRFVFSLKNKILKLSPSFRLFGEICSTGVSLAALNSI